MKFATTRNVLLTAAACVFISRAGFAQDLTGLAAGLTAGGGLEAGSIRAPMPIDTVKSKLQMQGYTDITGLTPSPDNKLLQASAMAPGGIPVDLTIEALTGSIITVMPRN